MTRLLCLLWGLLACAPPAGARLVRDVHLGIDTTHLTIEQQEALIASPDVWSGCPYKVTFYLCQGAGCGFESIRVMGEELPEWGSAAAITYRPYEDWEVTSVRINIRKAWLDGVSQGEFVNMARHEMGHVFGDFEIHPPHGLMASFAESDKPNEAELKQVREVYR